MATYAIPSRIPPQALQDPKDFKQLAEKVWAKIHTHCPGIVWKERYTTLERFGVVDIVQADDPKQVERAATIIRAHGY